MGKMTEERIVRNRPFIQLAEEDSLLKENRKKCNTVIVKNNVKIRNITVGEILMSGPCLRN